MSARLRLSGLVLAAMVLGSGARSRPAPPARTPAARAPAAPKRIVLVTIDTWRWDAIGVSGSGKVATPNLDAFAKTGLYCRKAWSSSTLTAPSHATILTGLQPYHHGIRNNHGARLDPARPMLASLLRERGYATAGFVSAHPLSKAGGFDRGFNTYDDRVAPGDLLSVVPRWRKGDETIDAATTWLATAPDRFFLWVHLYEPHDPYAPPEPFKTTYRKAPYFGEAAYADALVGRLKSALGTRGEKDALWIITGDHGEALGDHGEATHGLFVYDATARVPLIVWGPGTVRAGTLETARLVDVAPTILSLAGAKTPAGLDGRTLIGAKPAAGREDAYVETMYAFLDFGAAPVRALSDGRYKVIDVPKRETYDLSIDPEEKRNLESQKPPPAVLAARKTLAALPATAAPSKRVSDDDAKSLRSLGYVGAGGDYALARKGMDPKEFAPIYGKIMSARSLAERKRWKEAVPVYSELLATFPRSSLIACELGLVELALGKTAEATTHLRLALDRDPDNSHALLGLATMAIEQKDYRRAEAYLLDAVKLDENDVEANFNLGALYYQFLNQRGKAARYWQRFLELQPNDPEAPRIRQMLTADRSLQ